MGRRLWTTSRQIIHIDMDAFFAAIEQRDNPALRGKPIVVGGNPNGRGVVSTASYEARQFGIHSAMPAAQAKRLCPQAIFVRPRFSQYEAASEIIHQIFNKFTSLVEPMSLDEAYLDVTQNRLKIDDPVLLAKMIQQNIKAATQLTASAGVASNKYIAKIASDMRKPAGLTVVYPDQAVPFLEPLAVRQIPGVGPVTEKQLIGLGIQTIGDLAKHSREDLVRHFGKWGIDLYERARGIDQREVEAEWERKSIGSEETYERDLMNITQIETKLQDLSKEIAGDLKENGYRARTITLKVKYADFTVITRSHTWQQAIDAYDLIFQQVSQLLKTKTEAGKRPIRLLGVSASNLVTSAIQTNDETWGQSLPGLTP
ncbi:MAG: DNA polymerase IV [Candidatus Omnitrophica bacterium CG11_big_fil_rev_8_21_14_0_20_45_26]|uniref:DNA polymerase IV n=1 Tax=Candidatus Abzuiibacterium crystallinum TaxID=1974748 RepID=A0A2H0LPK4_9BACT|nr:MAG: DNA polymerase IV [Candidatus Omnitrophica bacterium CG11_big_fil_rev_8_21_14_0_20_45_26]PIW63550.1 MAG: DNA polymerase IV [Candidatus Omnitrophica bacterium CG12_big_fil_rev_8_21_14_0_65_45_16]